MKKEDKVRKSTYFVLGLTAVYLLAAGAYAVATGSKEFLLYLAVSPFIVGGVVFLHRKLDLPVSLLWALSFLGLVHCVGGLVMVPESWPTDGKKWLYNWWLIPDKLKFDQVVHTYGNAIATWLCWHLLRYSIALVVKREIKDIPARPVFLLICFLAGIGVGALNELLEFGASQTVPGDTNVGGYVNTGWDLVCNTVGGVLTCLVIWLKRKDKPLPTPACV